MRLAFLTLVLGLLVGFYVRGLTVNHPQWYTAFLSSGAAVAETPQPLLPHLEKPRTYPSPEKTLQRLQRQFDDAVVVVLADESYDTSRQRVHVSVVEVWKGPATLVGKRMDSALRPPLADHHASGTERVLKFMPMTPHVENHGTVYFEGATLRMNPTITVDALKAALTRPAEAEELKQVQAHRTEGLAPPLRPAQS